MRVRYLVVFLIVNFFVAAKASNYNEELQIKPYNSIKNSSVISLNLLIENETMSEDIKKDLRLVILGDAPEIGEQRVYTNKAVATAIRSKLGSRKYNFRIPNKIVVENPGHQVSQEQVEKKLMSHWRAKCADCVFELKSLSLPRLTEEQSQRPWKLDLSQQLPRGSFSQRLSVERENGSYSYYWVTGELKVTKVVPVLSKSLGSGVRISKDDIKWELRDITFASDTTPTKDQLFGSQMRFALNANEILWHRSIERERAVRRGEIVKVTFGDEGWEVALQARTEQDGHIGDVVNVRNIQTNKVISGEVVGRGEVVVR